MNPALYADVAAILAGPLDPPKPTIGRRDDGIGLIYAGAVNIIIGNPEAGKTLAASAIIADTLFNGGSALVLDLDHNGALPTLRRFVDYGVPVDTLADLNRFRYATPDEPAAIMAVVNDSKTWAPTVALIDSMGELLPLMGASSNDADDYTRVNRQVPAAIAATGSAVIVIDHLAKNSESASYGATGTAAKKRAADGIMLRATVMTQFTPGHGGKATLKIVKDRHGGLRAASPAGDREPLAAVFHLEQRGDAINWHFRSPAGIDPDVAELNNLNPAPTSVRDIRTRLSWGASRADKALKAWRSQPQKVCPITPGTDPTQVYPMKAGTK